MRAGATKPVTTAAKGVTDKVLSQIDLAGEKLALQGRLLRVRKLEIQPGGIVPWHSHEDRPALIYVVSGEINEYASNCAVPIVHKAGEVARETHGTSHWWKNNGKAPAVLLSFPTAGRRARSQRTHVHIVHPAASIVHRRLDDRMSRMPLARAPRSA